MAVPFLASIRRKMAEDPRLARMMHGGLSSLLGHGLAVLVSAVSLPITVRYLGRLEYGIWITISSSIVMFSVLDLGIANTLTNYIAASYADDDRDGAQRYFSTAFWLTVGISALAGCAALIVYRLVDWGSLFGLHNPLLIHQARQCVAIAMLFFLLSLPLNLANRVLGGYQQVHVANYFSMGSSVLGLGSILVTMALHGNIVQLMLAYSIAMLTGTLVLNLWVSFFHKPWIRPVPSKMQMSIARTLFGQGFLFFVLQLTGIVVFNSDNLVISHYLGATEVTPYSIAWRLTSYASLLQGMLVPSFWPAFTEAYRKRDMDWVRRTYRNTVQKTTLAVCAAALFIGLLGGPFIAFWAGKPARPPALLLWTMALWAVLVSYTTNQALLLTATSRLRVEAAVAVLAAIANLALSIFLVTRIGSVGVILATILSFALIMVIPQQLEVNRVLRGDFLPVLGEPDTLLSYEQDSHNVLPIPSIQAEL